jgi:cytochrome P450
MSVQNEESAAVGRASGCPVSSLAEEFDPFHDPYLSDPYSWLARARAEQPVFYSPKIDYYVVTRYDDIRAVYRDTKSFSATIALEPLTPLYDSSLVELGKWEFIPGPTLVNEDQPSHMIRRKRIGDAFLARNIAKFEPKIRSIVTGYLDKFVKNGRADLVRDFVWEISALVIFMFMGVPEKDIQIVKKFAAERIVFTWGRPTEAEQNELSREIGEYWRYCKQHVAWLRQNLGEDFMSEVIRYHMEDPDMMDEVSVYNVMLNFLFAGHETTTQTSANGFKSLLENRDQWAAICADPSLIPGAVEEILRFNSSVIAWRRRATMATTIGGVEIPEGAKILLVTGSANHDETIFPWPERFDIRRDNAHRNLAFGFGAHMCLGAPLARLEMRVILEELTRRLPHVQLVPNQRWEYSPNTSHRGPAHVLVEWDSATNPIPGDRP